MFTINVSRKLTDAENEQLKNHILWLLGRGDAQVRRAIEGIKKGLVEIARMKPELEKFQELMNRFKKEHPVKYFFKVTMPNFIDSFRR